MLHFPLFCAEFLAQYFHLMISFYSRFSLKCSITSRGSELKFLCEVKNKLPKVFIMFQKVCIAAFVLIALQNADCAMKKSWKSAANFDDEIPKFTPFDHRVELAKTSEIDLNEVSIQTKIQTSKSEPTANTLSSKISSKIKAPPKYVADMYKQLNKEEKKNKNDFGSFDADIQGDAPAPEPAKPIVSEATSETSQPEEAKEELEIKQILSALSDIVDRENSPSSSNDNKIVANEEGLDISTNDSEETNSTQYKVGPLMNVTIDSEDSVVKVNLDQAELKEIFTGSCSLFQFEAQSERSLTIELFLILRKLRRSWKKT